LPNLHRAFDRGLIAVNENYEVVISNTFREEGSYSIKNFEGKKINLPSEERFFPLINNFLWHKKNIFKNI
jgi:putative restriction endonuclease